MNGKQFDFPNKSFFLALTVLFVVAFSILGLVGGTEALGGNRSNLPVSDTDYAVLSSAGSAAGSPAQPPVRATGSSRPSDLLYLFATYSGDFDMGQTAEYLPTVVKDLVGQTSYLSIQNLTGDYLDITAEFYDSGGLLTSVSQTVPAYSPWDLDLADVPDLPGSYSGSAVVHAAGPMSVVARQVGPISVQAYGGSPIGNTLLHSLELYNSYDGWNSILVVQNVGTSQATVNVSYSDGIDNSAQIEPNRSYTFDQSQEGHAANRSFSAVITADEPVVAVSHPYKDAVAGGRSACEASAAGNNSVVFPQVLKEYQQRNSSILVENVGTAQASVTVTYEGYESDAYSFSLAAGVTASIFQGGEAFLPSGYAGAAFLSADQPIVATIVFRSVAPLYGDWYSSYRSFEFWNRLAPERPGAMTGEMASLAQDPSPALAIPASSENSLCDPVTGTDFLWMPEWPFMGEMVYFTGTAQGTAPISFDWDLGDGTTASGSTVNHAYGWGGDYQVVLTATNACGQQTIPHIVTVLDVPPVAYTTYFPSTPRVYPDTFGTWSTSLVVQNLGTGDATVTISFYDPAGDPHVPIELGPGRTNPFSLAPGRSTEISMTQVVELAAGAYAAVVSSDQPIIGVVTVEGQVDAVCSPPTGADFTWTPVVPQVGEIVTFTASAVGTLPITFEWDNGSMGSVATYSWMMPGLYPVTVTATNACGQQVVQHTIEIVEVPPTSTPTPTPTPSPEPTVPGVTSTPTRTPTSPTPVPTSTPGAPPTVYKVFLPVVFGSRCTCFCSPTEVEPNNDHLTANGPLCCGNSYSGFPADENDYFYFTTAGGTIRVNLQGYTSAGGQLLLYYEEEVSSRARAVAPPYEFEYNGPPGRYYVRIYTPGGDVVAPAYSFSVIFP